MNDEVSRIYGYGFISKANSKKFYWVDFKILSFACIAYESQQNKRSYIAP